jgi:hypothetical protein
MDMDEELYCKIYVDSDLDREKLVDFVAEAIGGPARGHTVESRTAEVDVKRNEDYLESADRGNPDNFVHYRYYFDVVPGGDGDRGEFIRAIGDLLTALWSAGNRAVGAADFEEELPDRGGYQRSV